MNKKIKKLLITILILIILLISAFQVYVYFSTYEPSNKLDELVFNDDYIYENNMYIFEPTNSNKKAILLYNGAFVDPYSYSYLSTLLKNEGYFVVVPKFFNNFSMFGANVGTDIINTYNEYSWYVMGHSLGGVSVASLLKENNDIEGIIFLASYPSNSTDLSNTNYKVLSIRGSNDTVLNMDSYNNAKSNLPSNTKYVVINGGNHAYFGMYGEQKGDTKATITAIEQQEKTVDAILEWDK